MLFGHSAARKPRLASAPTPYRARAPHMRMASWPDDLRVDGLICRPSQRWSRHSPTDTAERR
eukprot:4683077-Alexandrium_andersonii.AAC.1